MKILLGVEGSPFSEAAVQALGSHVRPEGADVLVLQVVDPIVYSVPPMMAADYAPEMAERLKQQIDHAKQTVKHAVESLKSKGFRAEGRVVESDVRAGILDCATEYMAELIVLGSHGRRGLKKFLLGSIAESVARHARCSVLIVRTTGEHE